MTLAVVDVADEEGARFSRSLLGSSGASGSLVPESARGLVDRKGVRLADALAENGVDLDRMPDARRALDQRHPRALCGAPHRARTRARCDGAIHRRGDRHLRNVAMVKGLGADHVIDYTKDDFTHGSQRYDLIVDTVGNRNLSELRKVMTRTVQPRSSSAPATANGSARCRARSPPRSTRRSSSSNSVSSSPR